jgi:DNA-binding NarL/FixJ family response regulator
MTTRVIVADDQEIVRTGLRMILDAQPGIEVVGELAPVLDRTYPLADTAEGLRRVEAGHARGKAVITVA